MSPQKRMPKALYKSELKALQARLVDMQAWVQASGARVVVIFEGRDAAGKGSTIKRVSEYLNPRVSRVVALPTPSARDKTRWYFQRYIQHLAAGGEIVLMDRSWYNRAGVERVMGYSSNAEYHRFLHQAPIFERMLVEDGIILLKYWFSVSDVEQERRFHDRLEDPMRRWKLSPNDVQAITKWEDYSRAKDTMFVHTDIPEAPWWEVDGDDKRRSRINMISHLLSQVPYEVVERLEQDPRDHLRHRGRLVNTLDLDGVPHSQVDGVPITPGSGVSQFRTHPDTRPHRHGVEEAHLVQSVIDDEFGALDPEVVLAQRRDERQGQEAVRDGRAIGALGLGPLDVNVNPLVIAGDLGEVVDPLLIDDQPITHSEFLTGQCLRVVDGCDDLHAWPPDFGTGSNYDLDHTNRC